MGERGGGYPWCQAVENGHMNQTVLAGTGERRGGRVVTRIFKRWMVTQSRSLDGDIPSTLVHLLRHRQALPLCLSVLLAHVGAEQVVKNRAAHAVVALVVEEVVHVVVRLHEAQVAGEEPREPDTHVPGAVGVVVQEVGRVVCDVAGGQAREHRVAARVSECKQLETLPEESGKQVREGRGEGEAGCVVGGEVVKTVGEEVKQVAEVRLSHNVENISVEDVLEKHPSGEASEEEGEHCRGSHALGSRRVDAKARQRRHTHPDPPPGVAGESLQGRPRENGKLADHGLGLHPRVVVGLQLADLGQEGCVNVDEPGVLLAVLCDLSTDQHADTQRLQDPGRVRAVLVRHSGVEDLRDVASGPAVNVPSTTRVVRLEALHIQNPAVADHEVGVGSHLFQRVLLPFFRQLGSNASVTLARSHCKDVCVCVCVCEERVERGKHSFIFSRHSRHVSRRSTAAVGRRKGGRRGGVVERKLPRQVFSPVRERGGGAQVSVREFVRRGGGTAE
eukprot:Rhum_TRINITY_DN14783_c13_g1::Rhum_TRINITY_DN14783_c13_g1_i1::g.118818::m.118818